MARRSRFSPRNLLSTMLGFAALGAVGYYLWREARLARPAASDGSGTTMMDLRRAGRKAGRSIKDAATQVGKEIRRGAADTAEAVQDLDSPHGPYARPN